MAKTVFIKVRVTEDEKSRYLAAAQAVGVPLSNVIRASLDRLARRATKETKR